MIKNVIKAVKALAVFRKKPLIEVGWAELKITKDKKTKTSTIEVLESGTQSLPVQTYIARAFEDGEGITVETSWKLEATEKLILQRYATDVPFNFVTLS